MSFEAIPWEMSVDAEPRTVQSASLLFSVGLFEERGMSSTFTADGNGSQSLNSADGPLEKISNEQKDTFHLSSR